MSIKYADDFLPLLYNALDEEFGTYVRTDNTKQLRSALYAARDNADDEALAELMFFAPVPNVILIAKRSTEIDEP